MNEQLVKRVQEAYGISRREAMVLAKQFEWMAKGEQEKFLKALEAESFARSYTPRKNPSLASLVKRERAIPSEAAKAAQEAEALALAELERKSLPAANPKLVEAAEKRKLWRSQIASRGTKVAAKATAAGVPFVEGAATPLPPSYLEALKKSGIKGGVGADLVGVLGKIAGPAMALLAITELGKLGVDVWDKSRQFGLQKQMLRNQLLSDAQALSYESNRDALERREAMKARSDQMILANQAERRRLDDQRLFIMSQLLQPSMGALGQIPQIPPGGPVFPAQAGTSMMAEAGMNTLQNPLAAMGF